MVSLRVLSEFVTIGRRSLMLIMNVILSIWMKYVLIVKVRTSNVLCIAVLILFCVLGSSQKGLAQSYVHRKAFFTCIDPKLYSLPGRGVFYKYAMNVRYQSTDKEFWILKDGNNEIELIILELNYYQQYQSYFDLLLRH